MRHGSLFSGIGGFDLAAEWMGWENVFHCEWMEFPRKVLDYYFPNADSHIDICKTDFKKYANTIDILTGGFPCQPFSMAGKRKGTDDERYLWGEMLRAIQEIKPTYVIAENVFGITNIDGGLVFEEVQADLEAEGYEVQAYILPACSQNAPHKRERTWFVAHSNTARVHKQYIPTKSNEKASRCGLSFEKRDFSAFPSEPPILRRDDGISKRLDSKTFSKWRNQSIKAYGNAIVPQVAYQIFKSICQYQEL